MARINLAEDTVSKADIEALAQWLLTYPRLTKGELTERFEASFAQRMGCAHAIYVSSGSSANLIAANALLSVKPSRNRTVIAPAVSWVTTVTPFLQLGYKVLMCDCDSQTLGVDLTHFEALCKRHQPDAAIIVHVLGHDSSIHAVRQICERYGVRLVEDTCEAIGSEVGGRKLGTFGDFGTFSFYFGHQLSSIEGGVIVTDDFELAQIAKSMRAHGWARDLSPEYRRRLETENEIDAFQSLYAFYYSGFNCRSTDLNAFLALRQIERLDDVVRARQQNFLTYKSYLGGFWSQASAAETLSSFAYAMIVANRAEVVAALNDAGVETRPLLCGNMARQPLFRPLFRTAKLPNADRVHDLGLYLPNHAHLTEAQIAHIAGVVNATAQPASFVRRKSSARNAA
jgi:CDP-6-deoxy-D-xylo-4-hexulose-3-dehydrase